MCAENCFKIDVLANYKIYLIDRMRLRNKNNNKSNLMSQKPWFGWSYTPTSSS